MAGAQPAGALLPTRAVVPGSMGVAGVQAMFDRLYPGLWWTTKVHFSAQALDVLRVTEAAYVPGRALIKLVEFMNEGRLRAGSHNVTQKLDISSDP